MSLRTLALLAITALSASCSAHIPPSPDPASGRLAQIEVVDRTTGTTLPVYWYRGERWIAGTPGHRYAIAVRNRTDGRILTVIAVDGINAVSGETASWGQTGYVLDAGRSYDIRGWRKSQERVAAFEFTALDRSYAARTGRPENVGVIGVAVFREARRPEAAAVAPAQSAKSESGAAARERDEAVSSNRADSRLGTGHGRSETSVVSYTDFERARNSPDEVVTLRYDSRENLLAMGVITQPRQPAPVPNPFPNSESGFVPDPPR
ncbi:MAG TPA: hypothetical protein VLW55_21240 [Burkholderiaceae bacterium]|nr:hypothetical protein [Burkholderiaceae bacterium]